MDLSFDESSSSSYQNCENPSELRRKFEEIILVAPKNDEWTTFTDLYRYQGFWYSDRFLEGTLLAQQHFKPQPDDIILCSTPESGLPWLKALAFAIMNRTSMDEESANQLHFKVPYLELDLLSPDRKPALLATHIPYTLLPDSIIDSKCKIVYICRNPKDVLASLWHSLGTVNSEGNRFPMEKAFELFCKGVSIHGPFWDHALGYWEASMKSPERLLFLTYEKLATETPFNVRRLAQFMGCPFSLDEERHGVVQKISANKTGKQYLNEEVEDHMNCLTKEMKDHIDQITEDRLKGYGLTFV